MSKVFIIQDSFKPKDYSSAANYGSIHFLLTPKCSPSVKPRSCRAKILKKLYADFDYKEDYIVWCGGDPAANFIAGSVARELNVPFITWLKYEKGRDLQGNRVPDAGFYVPVEIKLC